MALEKQWEDEIWAIKGAHLSGTFKSGSSGKARYAIKAEGNEFKRTISISPGPDATANAHELVKQIAEQMATVPLKDTQILAVEWI